MRERPKAIRGAGLRAPRCTAADACATQNLVVMTVRETRPGGIQVIASQSVSDTLGPPAPRGSVRARLVSGGGVILPAPDGGCDVMFMTQARGSRLAAASSPHVRSR